MASVITRSKLIVFCEGREGGLDAMFLHQIIPTGRAQIKPVGGKDAMRAFIEGHLAGYTGTPPKYIGFRDRDLDVEPPDTPQLIRLPGAKPIWMTYRACLENYFIDAQLLHHYWSQCAMGPAWKHGTPPSIETLDALIEQSARDLAEYQAVRWALAQLKPGRRWPSIRTTWKRKGSGHLPSSFAFDDCLTEARRLLHDFKTQANLIHQTQLETEADRFRHQFTQDDFYSSRAFLVWFHGKDLLAQLFKQLNSYLHSQGLSSNISSNHYLTSTYGAAQNIDPTHHPDLQELIRQCTA